MKNPPGDSNGLAEGRPLPDQDPEDELEVTTSDYYLNLHQKAFNLLATEPLCPECLGRQFSYLATATNNTDRANSILLSLTMEVHAALLAETITQKFKVFGHSPLKILEIVAAQAKFAPAYKALLQYYQKFGLEESRDALTADYTSHQCGLCHGILLPSSITRICQGIEQEVSNYDFENFLIGTYLNPGLANKEEDLRARLKITNGESFKANINRLVGIGLQQLLDKPTQFAKPDLQVMIDFREALDPTYELQPKSLYIAGVYKKFTRELPQTHWHCPDCRGRGTTWKTDLICPTCHGTGDMYPSSIEDLVGDIALNFAYGDKYILHGAGREDVDVRCLGTGRPFVLEIKAPQKRNLDFGILAHRINVKHGTKIHVQDLARTTKQTIVDIKKQSEFTEKVYHALIYVGQPISRSVFERKFEELKDALLSKIIYQRTPLRVAHRRADLTREKKVYELEGKYIDSRHIFCKIRTQGGTYIKELISSDSMRTSPSFAGIFALPMECVELDVIEVQK